MFVEDKKFGIQCDYCGVRSNHMCAPPQPEPLYKHSCDACYEQMNKGLPKLSLADLNEIRKRGITNGQYYKEKGYIN